MNRQSINEKKLGAMLVDLENLYFALRDEFSDAEDLTVLVLQNLRAHIENKLGISLVIGRAYAPLDYSSSRTFINDMSLLGIVPTHVMAKAEKNSADLMLAIDCMEVLFRREDISAFIIVGGDRDYIPVATRVKENARRVIVACPRHAMSGDLLTIIGEENYVDAVSLIPPERRTPASWERVMARARKDQPREDRQQAPRPAAAQAMVQQTQEKVPPATIAEVEKMIDDPHMMEDIRQCAKFILEYQERLNIKEVWLGPFLRTLNDKFPMKNNVERKGLINKLGEIGAIEIIERQRGEEGGTYAAIAIRWQHPLIVEMNPG